MPEAEPTGARKIVIEDELVAEILLAAARAYPEECCGLIEGAGEGGGWRAIAIHHAANIAPDRKRHFLIDPQVQFDCARRLRAGATRLIGCFHSHPDGEAKPSATDGRQAYEPGFLYLIAGGGPDSFALNAFVFENGGFAKVELAKVDMA